MWKKIWSPVWKVTVFMLRFPLCQNIGGHPGHMDKCLTAWYAYMRPQLLEQVNPENTSKDVWESLLEANRHYQIPGKV